MTLAAAAVLAGPAPARNYNAKPRVGDPAPGRAKEKGFPYPYLYDETQKIAKDHGATYTPEFFVLDRDRRLAYMGAMDDVSPPRQESKHFLDDAVTAVLAGRKPPVAETLARGC